MKFAKKYFLIDNDHYQQLVSSQNTMTNNKDIFTHPDAKLAKLGQKKMEQIADSEILTDSEKIQQHSQILKQYLENFRDAVQVERKQALLGTPASTNTTVLTDEITSAPQQELEKKVIKEPPTEGNGKQRLTIKAKDGDNPGLTMEEIVKTLPGQKRVEARKLLHSISKTNTLRWSDDGKVIYRGKTIRGSDIKQLVADKVGTTLRQESKKSVLKKFNEILNQEGISIRQRGAGVSTYRDFKKQIKNKWHCHE